MSCRACSPRSTFSVRRSGGVEQADARGEAAAGKLSWRSLSSGGRRGDWASTQTPSQPPPTRLHQLLNISRTPLTPLSLQTSTR